MSRSRQETAHKFRSLSPIKGENGSLSIEDHAKMMQQDLLRRRVIEEQLRSDPIIQYVALLNEHIVEDELQYQEQSGLPEEWTNIPKLVARFLIINQKHLKAIIGHCKQRTFEETTKSLRKFTEEEIKVSILPIDV